MPKQIIIQDNLVEGLMVGPQTKFDDFLSIWVSESGGDYFANLLHDNFDIQAGTQLKLQSGTEIRSEVNNNFNRLNTTDWRVLIDDAVDDPEMMLSESQLLLKNMVEIFAETPSFNINNKLLIEPVINAFTGSLILTNSINGNTQKTQTFPDAEGFIVTTETVVAGYGVDVVTTGEGLTVSSDITELDDYYNQLSGEQGNQSATTVADALSEAAGIVPISTITITNTTTKDKRFKVGGWVFGATDSGNDAVLVYLSTNNNAIPGDTNVNSVVWKTDDLITHNAYDFSQLNGLNGFTRCELSTYITINSGQSATITLKIKQIAGGACTYNATPYMYYESIKNI